MSLKTPLARVRGLGSAKDGTHHWWVQRLTAIALIPLALYFVWLLLGLAAADHGTVRLTLGQPFNAVLMAAFSIALFWHAQLGLQVVIEDYIHARWLEVTLQVLVRFATLLAILVALVAIGRLAFTG
ncbi:MAG: succinate dehydrogenase, hydrophobic membrane anchor protein [Lysobacteraceae bacterium]|jgi:succinate dehydrogenase / fumarate reductase membrane anchor subunit